MKAVITVIGKDKVGIIAKVSNKLAELQINILDINQTVMQDEYFTMIMLVDVKAINVSFDKVVEELNELGSEIGMDIKIQKEEIFHSMHRI